MLKESLFNEIAQTKRLGLEVREKVTNEVTACWGLKHMYSSSIRPPSTVRWKMVVSPRNSCSEHLLHKIFRSPLGLTLGNMIARLKTV